MWFIEAVQAWSILLWLAGACWFLGGRRLLWWSLPAIGFLSFMIPLPFRAERMLSQPLQAVAARFSCWLLQLLGQPAIREGNIVIINDIELAIVEACSGLRIFVSIVALAFAFAVFFHRPWWTKAALFASVLPVALISNAVRIALTGLLHVYFSGEAAHRFSHDAAGLFMIPFAAALMLGVVWYMDKLLFEVETASARDLLAGKAIAT
jgi:exosortase